MKASSFTHTMPRFYQTVLPLEKMLNVWVKLSVAFSIVSFVETLVYKNCTDTDTCEVSAISNILQDNLSVAEVMIISALYYLFGAFRAMVTIILPYYFTTYVISLYAC